MTSTVELTDELQESLPVRFLRAALKRWGASATKRKIWDREYAAGKWRAIDPRECDDRQRDMVYGLLEFYARAGDLLDLGCGTGSTAKEMENVYHSYLGVDISPIAIRRAEENIRQDDAKASKTVFTAADIATFSTDRRFDVILYRECLYYFPLAQIKLLLAGHGRFLRPNGVFILRLHDRRRFHKIVSYVCEAYSVVERLAPSSDGAIVLVFRPRIEAPTIALPEIPSQENSL